MAGQWDQSDFYSESASARFRGLNPFSHLILVIVALFFLLALLWAWRAPVDEVTVGEGKVVPSGQIQVVQNLEGGIISEILVREGAIVEEGAVLLRIDDTQFRSSFQESRLRYLSLLARAARLRAEADGVPFEAPPEAAEQSPELVASETALLLSRRRSLEATVEILQRQVEQRAQELKEAEAMRNQLRRRLGLARQELAITGPMVEQGVMSQVELLRLKRETAELEGTLESTTLAIPRIESSLAETRRKVEEPTLNFRSEALRELGDVQAELAGLRESETALADRVSRTALRAPVRGTVLQVMVTTIGQVVRPGMELMQIMPLEDSLLVEARIRPADIAFLRPGQPTLVKFTAYDFSIYGGLPGELTQISPDAITDERGENFYQIQVRTERNNLGDAENPLPIIPGMVAMVDIITGSKTVLDYLLKPILKARARALRER